MGIARILTGILKAPLTRLALALIVALAPALTFLALYDAQGPLGPVLFFGITAALLAFFRSRSSSARGRLLFGGLLTLHLLLGSLLVVTLVSITSASSYSAWFHFVRSGQSGSTISYYFVIKIILFGGFAATGIVHKRAALSILLYAFLLLSLLGVMHESIWFFSGGMGCLLAAGLLLDRTMRGSWSAQGLAAITQLVVLALGLAFLLMPLHFSGRPPASLQLVPRFVPAVLFRLWTDFPLAVDVPGFGGIRGTKPIDGRATLSAAGVFTLESGRPGGSYHIRTQSFDSYSASSWQNSSWSRISGNTGPLPQLGSGGFRLLGPRVREREILISMNTDFYSTIPHTLDTLSIDHRGSIAEFQYTGLDPGLITREPFPQGMSFMLSTGESSEPAPLPQEAQRAYLEIPPEIDGRVYELAESLARDSATGTIQAIQEHFFGNFSYSLNFPTLQADRDVVSSFLLDIRKGYCVQFASSMTILLRMLDIPARYVTGFYLSLPPDGDRVTVSGLNAHAWTEAWLPERGWVTVEATPPMLSGTLSSEQFYRTWNPDGDSLTRRQLEGIMGGRIEPPEPDISASRAAQARRRSTGQIIVLGLTGLMLLLLALLMPALAIFALLPVNLRISLYIRAIALVFPKKRLPSPEQSGWKLTLNYIDGLGWLGGPDGRMRLEALLLEHIYSARKLSLDKAGRLAATLRRLLLRSLK